MITIGITTFNRKKILTMMAKSLYESLDGVDYAIRLYDDASDDYDESFLKALFPDAKTIIRHKERHLSSGNIQFMYRDFLNYDDEYLFNADADLIFRKDWVDAGLKMIGQTDGILSLFNTPVHSPIGEKGTLCEKKHVGSAGTLLTRDVVEKICEDIDYNVNKGFDYAWCEAMMKRGKHLYCSKESYIQHIGLVGMYSKYNRFDYGKDFIVDSLENGQIINDVLDDYADGLNENWAGQKKHFFVFPYEKIEKGTRVVIYGAGEVGRDFTAQLRNNGYCKIVAVVDKNPKPAEGIIIPESLLGLDYEKIVLASANKDNIEGMIGVLKQLGLYEQDKVFFEEKYNCIGF